MTAAHDALALIGGLVHALVAIPERREGIPSYSLLLDPGFRIQGFGIFGEQRVTVPQFLNG